MFQLNMRDERLSQEERDLIDAAVTAGKVKVVQPSNAVYVDKFQESRDAARKERAAIARAEKKKGV